mgnify:CR=1 FL=1
MIPASAKSSALRLRKSGFTFAPSRPGDAAIVRELEAGLPRGTVDDEFIQCIGSS